jgi:fatty-acyl-CoA synthase
VSGGLSHLPPDESVPLLDSTVGELLREANEDGPDRTALVSGSDDRRWTYAELDAAADRAARLVASLVEPGEKLAVWATGLPEWIFLQIGAARAGAVLVPLNPAYREPELRYALRQSDSRAVFYGPDVRGRSLREVVERACADIPEIRHVLPLADLETLAQAVDPPRPLPEVRTSDPVMIQYTSGTTGTPKGAQLTHHSIVNNARFSALRAGGEPDWVWLNPLPLFHTGGCVFNALGAIATRATHVLMPAWDPGAALELIERERVNFVCCVPTMLLAMMEHPDFAKRDHSSLRHVLSGGTTVPPDLVRRIESTLGVNYIMVFGQTEAAPTICMSGPDSTTQDKSATVGYPLPHTEIRIADPNTGRTVPRNTTGEICVRGYGPMNVYYELPEETARAIDPEGWLRTGDLGQVNDRGYVLIAGRLKDIIRRGGESISPRTIEDVLFAEPGVGDVAVIGVPDERYGEQVVVFLRPAPDATLDIAALQRAAGEAMAFHMVPQYWIVVDELPLTPSGKIQKFVLRASFAAGKYTGKIIQRSSHRSTESGSR